MGNGKEKLKENPDTQLLENVADLAFVEHYMPGFINKHPKYDEGKWLGIIRKTWKKMSSRAQQFAFSGGIRLPEPLARLSRKQLRMVVIKTFFCRRWIFVLRGPNSAVHALSLL
ncbi:MAG TPA: DUF4202 family protein [Acidiferrobacteraceae bacterium]|nr:DUF4202 family protein [Acidiferrobacteraceae bacterium]